MNNDNKKRQQAIIKIITLSLFPLLFGGIGVYIGQSLDYQQHEQIEEVLGCENHDLVMEVNQLTKQHKLLSSSDKEKEQYTTSTMQFFTEFEKITQGIKQIKDVLEFDNFDEAFGQAKRTLRKTNLSTTELEKQRDELLKNVTSIYVAEKQLVSSLLPTKLVDENLKEADLQLNLSKAEISQLQKDYAELRKENFKLMEKILEEKKRQPVVEKPVVTPQKPLNCDDLFTLQELHLIKGISSNLENISKRDWMNFMARKKELVNYLKVLQGHQKELEKIVENKKMSS